MDPGSCSPIFINLLSSRIPEISPVFGSAYFPEQHGPIEVDPHSKTATHKEEIFPWVLHQAERRLVAETIY